MATHADTTPAPAVTTTLADLIASHRAMMSEHEALYDVEDDSASDAQDMLYKKLLASRKAILDRRPQTLEEVAMKARLMASDRAFNFWDVDGIDIEDHIPEIIASLIPAGLEAEGQRDAA
jgi:hypothetical protein